MGAKPWEALEIAVQNLKVGKCQLLSQEDKENFAGLLVLFLLCRCCVLLLTQNNKELINIHISKIDLSIDVKFC